MVRYFFHMLPRNIIRSFWGTKLFGHILAISITFFIVRSGIDWMYFKATRPFPKFLVSAVILGWLVPIVFPIGWFIAGYVRRNQRMICVAFSTAQAAITGFLISSLYKAITGRPSPNATLTLIDTSRNFHFGFLRGGVLAGWPSSHTTIAFSMATAAWVLYPDSKMARFIALFYALYIGVGVSITAHWFSDFVAGSIIGTMIGVTAGNSFKLKRRVY